ncbi:MAG: hypothetical protein AAGB32_02375 [Pseudomonadota bacterium]
MDRLSLEQLEMFLNADANMRRSDFALQEISTHILADPRYPAYIQQAAEALNLSGDAVVNIIAEAFIRHEEASGTLEEIEFDGLQMAYDGSAQDFFSAIESNDFDRLGEEYTAPAGQTIFTGLDLPEPMSPEALTEVSAPLVPERPDVFPDTQLNVAENAPASEAPEQPTTPASEAAPEAIITPASLTEEIDNTEPTPPEPIVTATESEQTVETVTLEDAEILLAEMDAEVRNFSLESEENRQLIMQVQEKLGVSVDGYATLRANQPQNVSAAINGTDMSANEYIAENLGETQTAMAAYIQEHRPDLIGQDLSSEELFEAILEEAPQLELGTSLAANSVAPTVPNFNLTPIVSPGISSDSTPSIPATDDSLVTNTPPNFVAAAAPSPGILPDVNTAFGTGVNAGAMTQAPELTPPASTDVDTPIVTAEVDQPIVTQQPTTMATPSTADAPAVNNDTSLRPDVDVASSTPELQTPSVATDSGVESPIADARPQLSMPTSFEAPVQTDNAPTVTTSLSEDFTCNNGSETEVAPIVKEIEVPTALAGTDTGQFLSDVADIEGRNPIDWDGGAESLAFEISNRALALDPGYETVIGQALESGNYAAAMHLSMQAIHNSEQYADGSLQSATTDYMMAILDGVSEADAVARHGNDARLINDTEAELISRGLLNPYASASPEQSHDCEVDTDPDLLSQSSFTARTFG